MRDHIAALHAAFRDQHDIEDSKGDDRPTPRPNWAMKATALLEEIEELIPAGAGVAKERG